MTMPQDTSTSRHDPSTSAAARLADTAGRDQPATPREVAGQLASGGFFWLDLESPDEGELAEFCQSLGLSACAIEKVTHPVSARRSPWPRARFRPCCLRQ
jgi:Mg2+ and Co2+ transporter CorA